MVTFVDDRTDEQKKTHTLAVVGTDRFMSGWGGAAGGLSYAGWAFKDGQEAQCFATIDNRSDMQRVRVVALDGYRAQGAAHCHIYVFN
ncbi:hypothetical protein CMI37_14570 [Candidatus Pacearchaeota archaeon]|nr:hypothetical protein [Candidatus Pacearchaeota archaeon]|tara:strand:- start:2203 stop:2466 length:264 start_codon:yes stop_codon:yes gene_type:complete